MPRDQRRNRRKIWYARPLPGFTEIRDDDGNRTGTKKREWEGPFEYWINVAPYASGLVATSGGMRTGPFGEYTLYQRTMSTSRMNCPIREGDYLWIDRIPSETEWKGSHDYRVTKRTRSKNELTFGIRQEDTNEPT